MSTGIEPSVEAKKEALREAALRLSRISASEYQLVRAAEAKKLGVTLKFLDNIIGASNASRRAVETSGKKNLNSSTASEGVEDELEKGVEPWSETVDGDALAVCIFGIIKQHVILSDEQAMALTLWVFGSYCINAFGAFARVLITSPEKRCGKTTLLRVLHSLVNRAVPSSNISSSAIFRMIEEYQPTLLIDEADTFLNKEGNEEITGILNSGHERIFAYSWRTEGEGSSRKPKKFSTWTPVVMSMIKLPKSTIVDRSVRIQMKRKLVTQNIKAWPYKKYIELKPIRAKLQRWAKDNFHALETNSYIVKDKTDLPELDGFNDRVKDGWAPLFAIASLLGDKWIARAAAAIKVLGRINDKEPDGFGVELLRDIRSVFEYRGVTSMHSSDLTEGLNAMDDRPWNSFLRGRPINTHTVGKLLRPYMITSKNLYAGQSQKRGYLLEDFKEAFESYL